MPVPFTTLVNDDGTPDFRINDVERWREAALKRLCSLCGQPLSYWIWFIGGGRCIREGPLGVFGDLGMHEECARYAIEVCPFLTGRRSDYSTRDIKTDAAAAIIVDTRMARPERLGLFKTRSYRVMRGLPLRIVTGEIVSTEWFWERRHDAGAEGESFGKH